MHKITHVTQCERKSAEIVLTYTTSERERGVFGTPSGEAWAPSGELINLREGAVIHPNIATAINWTRTIHDELFPVKWLMHQKVV